MQRDRSLEGEGTGEIGGLKWEEDLEVASMVVEGTGVVMVMVEVRVDSPVMGRVGARVERRVMLETWVQGQGEVVDKREVVTGARVGLEMEVVVAPMLRLGWFGRQSRFRKPKADTLYLLLHVLEIAMEYQDTQGSMTRCI